MGCATLILAFGDAFHLIPRILSYFIDSDLSFYLGVGKLITSITMTLFYIFMYHVYLKTYKVKERTFYTLMIYYLSFIRILFCSFSENGWFTNDGELIFGIIRNIPFVMLGGIIIYLYYKEKDKVLSLRNIWVYILLSFLFYIPVVLYASIYPFFGMFMLPKTVCYILIILSFKRYLSYE